MIPEIVRDVAAKLCSFRSPYYAFVHSKNIVAVYNSTTFEFYECSLAGHDLTSMITTDRGVLIGTRKGTYVQFAYEYNNGDQPLRAEFYNINCFRDKPLFLFGGDGDLLCVGTEWKGPLDRMRCGRVAIVRQGESSFLPLQGVIVAHQFDSRYSRQLFVMESKGRAQYQLWMAPFEANYTPVIGENFFTLEMPSIFREGHEDWSVQAVSRNGHVAFINGGVLCIVDPTSNLIEPEMLFTDNAVKRIDGGCTAFIGQEDAMLVYCAISGRNSLQICVAGYSEREWKAHTSFVVELQKELTLIEPSIVRDSGEYDNGAVIQLLSESKLDGKVCTLIPLVPDGSDALENVDRVDFNLGSTEVSLLDRID
jgi:hypothetical protein